MIAMLTDTMRQLTCIVTAIVQNSTCELLDTTCICSSVALNEAAALCIAESCSVRDTLGMWNAANHHPATKLDGRLAMETI